MAGIALTQSNLLSTQIGQDDAWSANAPASAPAADISWSHYEDIGHATGAAIRKRIVGAAQSTAKTAFKPIQQAVDIPIQVGKQGTENALARALPGIMRRATPLLRKKVEQRLRRLADGEEDINAWRPSRLREKIFLRLELSDEQQQQQQQQQAARGGGGGGGAAAAAAPLIEELDVALLEVAPNTSSKDSSGQNASSSSSSGGGSSSSSGLNSRSVCLAAKTLVNISLRPHGLKLIADLLPSPSQPQQPATAAAGSGSAASSRQQPPQTAPLSASLPAPLCTSRCCSAHPAAGRARGRGSRP